MATCQFRSRANKEPIAKTSKNLPSDSPSVVASIGRNLKLGHQAIRLLFEKAITGKCIGCLYSYFERMGLSKIQPVAATPEFSWRGCRASVVDVKPTDMLSLHDIAIWLPTWITRGETNT